IGSNVVAFGGWGGEYRIVRQGNTLTVFHRATENPYAMELMTKQTINLPSTVYLGFAVMGQDWGNPLTADFTETYLVGGSDVHPLSPPVLTSRALSPTEVQLSWTNSNVNPLLYE